MRIWVRDHEAEYSKLSVGDLVVESPTSSDYRDMPRVFRVLEVLPMRVQHQGSEYRGIEYEVEQIDAGSRVVVAEMGVVGED